MTQDQLDALRILSALDRSYDDPEYANENRRADMEYKASMIFPTR